MRICDATHTVRGFVGEIMVCLLLSVRRGFRELTRWRRCAARCPQTAASPRCPSSAWWAATRRCPAAGPGWQPSSCTGRGAPSSGAAAPSSPASTCSPRPTAPGTPASGREYTPHALKMFPGDTLCVRDSPGRTFSVSRRTRLCGVAAYPRLRRGFGQSPSESLRRGVSSKSFPDRSALTASLKHSGSARGSSRCGWATST